MFPFQLRHVKVPDVGNLPGWLALVVAAIGGYVSYRNQRREERSGVVDELQGYVKTLKEEIDRLNARSERREAETRAEIEVVKAETVKVKEQLVTTQAACQKQINTLQVKLDEQIETTLRQAALITQLERRRAPRTEKE